MDLSIIIVSWNAKDYILRCLSSIYSYTNNLDFEVIVVDNQSSDGSTKAIENNFSQVKLIKNSENFGFAKANNQALEKSRGKYILFLNDDTEIFGNIFFILVNEFKELEKHMKIGMLGCKLLNQDKSLQLSVRKNPSLWNQVILLTKLHNLFPVLLNKYFQKDLDYSKQQEVEQIMGSFMLTKKEILYDVGSFDENFFIWYEEVDLQKRIYNKGYKVYYTPLTSCVHVGGVSFSQLYSFDKQLKYNQSMLKYIKKHGSFLSWFTLLLLQPLSLSLALIIQIFKIKK